MASDGSSSLDNSLESCEKKPFVMLIDSIEVNMIIEAKDKYENWFISKVVAVDKELKKVKVHFAGWGSRFDEWIDIDKQRLREAGPNATERYHRKRDKPLKVGDRVQTKWEDKRSYLGRIVGIREDQADILFDDGVQVTRPLSSVRRRLQDRVLNKSLEDTVKKEASLQALAEARRRRARKRRNDDDLVTTDDYSSPPSSPLPERRRRKSIPLALLSDDEMETDKLDTTYKDETSKKLTKDKEYVAMETKTESQSVSVKKEYKEEPLPPVDDPPIDTTCSPAVQQNIADMETEGVSLKDTVHIKPDPDSQKSPAKVRKRKAPKLASSEGEGTPRKQSNRLKLKKDVHVHTVKSDKEKPVHLAPKEYVVVLDHNKFKCHFTDCKKSFRKEILLNAHLKHYHNIQVEEKQPTINISNPKPKGLPGRPSKSTSGSKKSSELQSKKDSSLEHKPSKISPKQKGTSSPGITSFSAKANSHSTPLKQSHTSTPRKGGKNKSQSKDAKTIELPLDASELIGISPLSKLNVPPEEKGDQFYKHMKTKADDPSDIVRVENSEMYRDRGKLRPLRKSSHGSNIDLLEAESEETLGDTTEDSEGEELEGMVRHTGGHKEADVVHCACGDNADEGFMIQCDQCLTWQHGDCAHIEEGDAPEQYLCRTCCNPPGRRNRIIHKFQREWFTKGRLPTLPGGPELSSTQREVILHSHKLADVLCRLKKMVHCTKIKLDAVKIPNHNYMKHWVKQCSHINNTEIHNYLMKVLFRSSIYDGIPMSGSLDEVGVADDIAMETETIVDGSDVFETPLIDAMLEVEVDKALKEEITTLDYSTMTNPRLTTPSPSMMQKDDMEVPLPSADNSIPTSETKTEPICTSEQYQADTNDQLESVHVPVTPIGSTSTGTSTGETGTSTVTPIGSISTGTSTSDTGTSSIETATFSTAVTFTGTLTGTSTITTSTSAVGTLTSTVTSIDTGTDDISAGAPVNDSTVANTSTGITDAAVTATSTGTTATSIGTAATSIGTTATSTGTAGTTPTATLRMMYVSRIVKEICERIIQGDSSTHWFHKLLLLDHISHVQDKMATCLDEVDRQMMEVPSPVALEDCKEILIEVQKTSSDLNQLRRSLVSTSV